MGLWRSGSDNYIKGRTGFNRKLIFLFGSCIFGVSFHTKIRGNTYKHTKLDGNADIYNYTFIYNNADTYDYSDLFGNSRGISCYYI